MKEKSKQVSASKRPQIVYRGSGAAILGNNPSIRTKEQADKIIASMLNRQVRPS